MPVGNRNDPYQGFNFIIEIIEIKGIIQAVFSECSGLQVETEFFDYREGGVNEYVHRLWGPTKYPPLVLKRGLTQDDGLWGWYRKVTQGEIKRKNGIIYLLNSKKDIVLRWNFKEAYPYKWTGPELRADSGNVVFESVELSHRGLDGPIKG